MLGGDAVVPTEQSLGGEDFSWMLQRVPGAMARLGVASPDAPAGQVIDIHQPRFDPDERAIGVGVAVLTRLCATVVANPERPQVG